MNLKGNFKRFLGHVKDVDGVHATIAPVVKGDAPALTAGERAALVAAGGGEGSGTPTGGTADGAADSIRFSFSNDALPTLQSLGLDEPVYDDRRVVRRRGGETAGLERMEEYLFEGNHLPTYWHTREQFGKVRAVDDSSTSFFC